MDKKLKQLLNELENLEFNISNSNIITAQCYTPAGEDWVIEFESLEDFISYAENFDIEENLRMWIEAKENGITGVPDIETLLKDQKWKKNLLNKILKRI